MGDRVSIQFKDPEGRLSAVVSDHWGGMEAVEAAKAWLADFRRKNVQRDNISTPETRLEADCLMRHFLKETDVGDRVVQTENDCDNSDNGHHVLPTKPAPPARSG